MRLVKAKQRGGWDVAVLMAGAVIVSVAAGCSASASRAGEEYGKSYFRAKLEYREEGDASFVSIAMPALAGRCEIWCYEGGLGKAVKHERDGKVLILTHKWKQATVTSRFEPVDDGVEVRVEVTGSDAESVKAVNALNPCWQLRRSDAFRWRGRGEGRGDYVEDFVARCFVILEGGLTLLKNTRRVPGTRPRKNDPANYAEPWIQEYVPLWRKHPGQVRGNRGYSLDRPVYPLIGCVSRDGRVLAAIAWPETRRLGQVWHDCLHPRSVIGESYDEGTNRIVSRARLYFMPNDEAVLLAAFKRDFPDWRQPVRECSTAQ